MEAEALFGKLIRERRQALGLSQVELAGRVGCATVTERKIETGDLRPSIQMAERLAMALVIPLEERAEFVRQARSAGLRTPEPPPTPTPTPSREEIGQEDLSGRAVHGYELGERIGTGGFGVVYRAVQPVVERDVAIKIILPEYANQPDFIRRFEAEARLVARLEHPHIVPLYDYWREPDAAYLVMRLLRGGNLSGLLQKDPLALEQFLRMIEQISAALHSAHRYGVIHRDLKPANILLDEEHNAYLADFGIAKNLGSPEADDQTRIGAMVGSPAYASPEQIRCEGVRPQSDIYCLGILMFEMLCGNAPFQGPTPIDYIMQHLNIPLPPVNQVRPELPAALDVVLQRATAKKAEDRYPDVPALLGDLHAALSGVAGIELAAPLEATGEVRNPYKGLRAFGEADADDFFGREALVRDLLGRMSEDNDLSRFLAVVGPSGSGKSSVVKAGLAPALRRGGLPGSENWFITQMTPGAHPLEELEAALLRVAVNQPPSLLTQLKEDERGLLRAVRRILPEDGETELVLIIDQFEELFTLTDSEKVRAHFMESLLAAVLEPNSRLHVVITLRADFTDRPLQYVDFGELVRQRTEFVLPLTPDELEQAITGPARHGGLTVEPGLVARMVREVGDQPGALPLLQYALTELYEQRDGRRLTQAAYQKIGGTGGALAQRAEQIYAGLGELEQKAARQVFLRLVTLGEGVEDTRRRVLRSEIEALSGSKEEHVAFEYVLEKFGQYHLLTFDHDPRAHTPTLEVAHEALLREWPRLRGWLDESRAELRMQRALGSAAAEWEAGNREASFLLRGARLEQFESWSQTTGLALTSGEQEYLRAGLAQREIERQVEAERQRKEARLVRARQIFLRAFIGVLIVGLVVAAGLSIYAFSQRREAVAQRQEALTQRQAALNQQREAQKQSAILLASQAEDDVQNGYHDRAVLLALEALEKYPYTSQAEHALGQAVLYDRAKVMYAEQNGVTGLAWSPDGKSIASSSSNDNNVHIWDPATGKTLQVIEMPRGITGNKMDMALNVRWTLDGKHILTLTGDRYLLGSQDFNLIVWDAVSGEKLSIINISNQAEAEWSFFGDIVTSVTHYPTGSAIDLSPTSGRLATLGGDSNAIIWDSAYQAPELILTGHTGGVNSVAWSPDGERLATAGQDGTARIWDGKNGAALLVLQGHAGRVMQALWSPDGKTLATAGEDGSARLWDAQSGAVLREIQTNSGIVWSLAWSPDGERLVTGQDDASLRFWDVSSGKLLLTLRGHTALITNLAWLPSDQRLASADANGLVRIWNAAISTALIAPPYKSMLIQPDFSHDGRYLALNIGNQAGIPPIVENFLTVYDLQTGKQIIDRLHNYDFQWWHVEYSRDDQVILAQGDDAEQLLAGEWSTAEFVYLFNAWSGEMLQTFTPKKGSWLTSLDWSPDETKIAIGLADGGIIIWDYQAGKPITELAYNHGFMEHEVQWSPDGSKIASANDDGSLRVWDAHTWKLLYVVRHESPSFVYSVRWSPDGSRLLTGAGNDDFGTKDNTARIWDSATGKLLRVISGHTRQVSRVEWSLDGSRVATASSDGTTRIWDASTGAELLSIATSANYFSYVGWSRDGKLLVTGGTAGPPRVWPSWQSKEELLAYARECCVIRELTPEERLQYGLPSAEASPQPTPTTVPPTPGASLLVQPLALLAAAAGLLRLRNSISSRN